jgi:hypothetical protein
LLVVRQAQHRRAGLRGVFSVDEARRRAVGFFEDHDTEEGKEENTSEEDRTDSLDGWEEWARSDHHCALGDPVMGSAESGLRRCPLHVCATRISSFHSFDAPKQAEEKVH